MIIMTSIIIDAFWGDLGQSNGGGSGEHSNVDEYVGQVHKDEKSNNDNNDDNNDNNNDKLDNDNENNENNNNNDNYEIKSGRITKIRNLVGYHDIDYVSNNIIIDITTMMVTVMKVAKLDLKKRKPIQLRSSQMDEMMMMMAMDEMDRMMIMMMDKMDRMMMMMTILMTWRSATRSSFARARWTRKAEGGSWSQQSVHDFNH